MFPSLIQKSVAPSALIPLVQIASDDIEKQNDDEETSSVSSIISTSEDLTDDSSVPLSDLLDDDTTQNEKQKEETKDKDKESDKIKETEDVHQHKNVLVRVLKKHKQFSGDHISFPSPIPGYYHGNVPGSMHTYENCKSVINTFRFATEWTEPNVVRLCETKTSWPVILSPDCVARMSDWLEVNNKIHSVHEDSPNPNPNPKQKMDRYSAWAKKSLCIHCKDMLCAASHDSFAPCFQVSLQQSRTKQFPDFTKGTSSKFVV